MSNYIGQFPEQQDTQPAAEGAAATATAAQQPRVARRRNLAQPLVLLGVLALGAFLRLYVYESDIVQGTSMLPGLRSGDYLLICKVSYRTHKPRRFDIVTFPSPVNEKEVLVKRVIGLPGEWVMIWNGKVYVNGRELKEGYARGGSRTYTPPTWVPEGHVYVLGDSRDNSEDSREWGTIPISSLRGKAIATFFPLNRARLLRWSDQDENR